MTYRTIIDPQQLHALTESDDELVILDARFSLDDEDWGDRAFAEDHIPGAQRADLARHLSGPIIEGKTGRRPFPRAEDFAETVRGWGVGAHTQVVVYDADRGLMAASRVWFMLRWLGHEDVAVLDGGFPAWIEAGYPLTSDALAPPVPSSPFVPSERPEMVADVVEVDSVRESQPTRVFDSRGPEGYHGQGKYYDPVRGHIKGAGLADRAETITTTDASAPLISCVSITNHFEPARNPARSFFTADRESPRRRTFWPWNMPACPGRACMSARGVSGSSTRNVRWNCESSLSFRTYRLRLLCPESSACVGANARR